MNEKILYENEINTNRVVAKVLVIFAAILTIIGLLGMLNIIENVYKRLNVELVILGVLAFFVCLIVGKKFYTSPHSKQILVGMLLLECGYLYFLYPLVSVFLAFGPILVSLKYYDRKFTTRISYETIGAFVAVTILAYHLANTSFVVCEYYAYEGVDLYTFNPSYIALTYVIPRIAVIVITALLGISICEGGHSLVNKQTEISEKANRMKAELEAAAEIQMHTTPDFEFITDDGSINLNAFIKPAREVGGDLFDYFMPNNNILAVIVADISDKGLASSMYGVRLISAIHYAFREIEHNGDGFGQENCIREGAEPGLCDIDLAEIAGRLNRTLCDRNEDDYFATCCIVLVDCRNGEIKVVNAGHERPLILRTDGRVEIMENDEQIPFGLFDFSSYLAQDYRLEKGDSVFIYTDGLGDALAADGSRFGGERILRAAESLGRGNSKWVDAEKSGCENSDNLSEMLVNGMVSEVYDFIGEADQFDDITTLAFTYNG